MFGVKSTAGYTIVEVMIFLSITGLLLAAAGTYIAGQQDRAYFADAARDAESLLEEIGNDVGVGYIPQKGEFSCTGSPTGPVLTQTTGIAYQQGMNPGCQFLGKVIKFERNKASFTLITIVGNSKTSSGRDVQNFAEAMPKAVTPTAAQPRVDLNDTRTFKNGLIVTRVLLKRAGAPSIDIGAFGIFSTFPQYSGASNDLASGTQSVLLVPIMGTSLDSSIDDIVASVSNVTEADADNLHSLLVCFRHGAGGKKVALAMGVGGRRLTTNLALDNVDIFTGFALNDPAEVGVCP